MKLCLSWNPLWRTGWPPTQRNLCVSASRVLGLKACHHTLLDRSFLSCILFLAGDWPSSQQGMVLSWNLEHLQSVWFCNSEAQKTSISPRLIMPLSQPSKSWIYKYTSTQLLGKSPLLLRWHARAAL